MATTSFIKLRGLPYSSTEIDILTFLAGLPVWNEQSVLITANNGGRPSGEAIVKLEQMININDLRAYNGRYMGNRFIEVFPSSQGEFFGQENGQQMVDMTLVRIRGLPYDTTMEDVYLFFNRLMIAREGVGLLIGPDDIPTGEAFVQFVTVEDTNMAIQRHNQCIRSRYIEVYKSTFTEAIRAMEKQYEINREELLKRARNMSQNYPYQNADGYGQNNHSSGPMRHNRDTSKFRATPYSTKPVGASQQNAISQNYGQFTNPNQTTIFMRGLPYSASEQDIYDFFQPLPLAGVKLFRANDGKLTGEAEAEFQTPEDALVGMQKDRCKIGWRYIELFTNAPERA